MDCQKGKKEKKSTGTLRCDFSCRGPFWVWSVTQSPNFVRSNQESLGANSLVINTNDATKGKNDES